MSKHRSSITIASGLIIAVSIWAVGPKDASAQCAHHGHQQGAHAGHEQGAQQGDQHGAHAGCPHGAHGGHQHGTDDGQQHEAHADTIMITAWERTPVIIRWPGSVHTEDK